MNSKALIKTFQVFVILLDPRQTFIYDQDLVQTTAKNSEQTFGDCQYLSSTNLPTLYGWALKYRIIFVLFSIQRRSIRSMRGTNITTQWTPLCRYFTALQIFQLAHGTCNRHTSFNVNNSDIPSVPFEGDPSNQHDLLNIVTTLILNYYDANNSASSQHSIIFCDMLMRNLEISKDYSHLKCRSVKFLSFHFSQKCKKTLKTLI